MKAKTETFLAIFRKSTLKHRIDPYALLDNSFTDLQPAYIVKSIIYNL